MGFLFAETDMPSKNKKQSVMGVDILRNLGCEGCPLQNCPTVEPVGSETPTIYVLGDHPSQTDVDSNKPFSATAKMIKSQIPSELKRYVRFNNIVKSRPKRGRSIDWQEIESCRQYIEADIVRSKPYIIVLNGKHALKWMLDSSKAIQDWRGRIGVTKIHKHICWFAITHHPEELIQQSEGRPWHSTQNGFAFIQDWARIIDLINRRPNPREWFERQLPEKDKHPKELGLELITGKGDNAYRRFEKALKKVEQDGEEIGQISVDIETNGLRPYKENAKLLSIAIGTYDYTLAVSLDHKDTQWTRRELQDVKQRLSQFFHENDTPKVAHNAIFELEWLAYFFGWDVAHTAKWEDTQCMAYLLDERRDGQSLDDMTRMYLGFALKDYSDIDVSNLDNEDLYEVLRYNALDVKYTDILCDTLLDELERREQLHGYENHVGRLPALAIAQLKGVPVDFDQVQKMSDSLREDLDRIEQDMRELSAVRQFEKEEQKRFNPASSDHAIIILRDYLRRKEVETKDGYSSKAEILEQIAHPFARLLSEYRKKDKNNSSFVQPLLNREIVWPDGKIHTNYNSTFTRSGRLSSSLPNLQNQPKRTDKWIRRYFQAPEGWVIISADYGQLEARVIAAASEDPYFKEALENHYDIHMEWAEIIAHEYPKRIGGKDKLKDKDVMKNFRTDIKNQWTFPLFFGATRSAVSHYLQIPEEVIAPLYEQFWSTFYKVKEWQESIIAQYRSVGYVESKSGRRRHAPISENQLINSPIQGDASDLTVNGMEELGKLAYKKQDYNLAVVLNIHDDLTFLVPEDYAEYYLSHILDKMLNPTLDWVTVPIASEVEMGYSWDNMEEIGSWDSNSVKIVLKLIGIKCQRVRGK